MLNNERPAYRILSPNGFFGPDDNLYAEDSEIYYDGEPNEEMEPLNEAAREKITALYERLDNLAREAAAKAGKQFVGRPKTLDGALELASAQIKREMSIMGRERNTAVIEPINGSNTPEVGSANPKQRGRPRKVVQAA